MTDMSGHGYRIDDKINNPAGWWTVYRHGMPIWHWRKKEYAKEFMGYLIEGMEYHEAHKKVHGES